MVAKAKPEATRTICLPIPATLHDQVGAVAIAEDRSFAYMLRQLLREALAARAVQQAGKRRSR